MSAPDVQSSLDNLTTAALVYPWSYTFRTAQAKQLFALAHREPALIAPAERSLTNAIRVDPFSLELASAIYATRIALRDCVGAARVAERLRVLAPHRFAPQECRP